jgi:hypothetical protein
MYVISSGCSAKVDNRFLSMVERCAMGASIGASRGGDITDRGRDSPVLDMRARAAVAEASSELLNPPPPYEDIRIGTGGRIIVDIGDAPMEVPNIDPTLTGSAASSSDIAGPGEDILNVDRSLNNPRRRVPMAEVPRVPPHFV